MNRDSRNLNHNDNLPLLQNYSLSHFYEIVLTLMAFFVSSCQLAFSHSLKIARNKTIAISVGLHL